MNGMAVSCLPRLRRARGTGMNRHGDGLLRVESDEALAPSITRLRGLLGDLRSAAQTLGKSNAALDATFTARGFHLHATWPQTTVFYDAASDGFFKALNRRSR